MEIGLLLGAALVAVSSAGLAPAYQQEIIKGQDPVYSLIGKWNVTMPPTPGVCWLRGEWSDGTTISLGFRRSGNKGLDWTMGFASSRWLKDKDFGLDDQDWRSSQVKAADLVLTFHDGKKRSKERVSARVGLTRAGTRLLQFELPLDSSIIDPLLVSADRLVVSRELDGMILADLAIASPATTRSGVGNVRACAFKR